MDITDVKLERILVSMIEEREALLYLQEMLSRFRASRAEHDDLQKRIALLQAQLAGFEEEAERREKALNERLRTCREQAREEELALNAERMKRERDNAAWKASLAQTEKEHQDNLAKWVSRIEGARVEHATITAQIAQAKSQREAILASLKDG